MKKLFFLFLLAMSPLFPALSLYNDSPFPLTVRVVAANGLVIAEKEIDSQGHAYIEDQLGMSDPVGRGEGRGDFENSDTSLTPYQVFWYCKEGSLYSVCLDAGAGATVTANTCGGDYGCKKP